MAEALEAEGKEDRGFQQGSDPKICQAPQAFELIKKRLRSTRFFQINRSSTAA